MNYQSGFQAPPLSPTNKKIIIALVASFILNGLLQASANISLNYFFALNLELLKSGFLWQIITYPLANNSLMGLVFGCLIIWFIGSELEFRWNKNFYLKFLMITSIGSALLYLVSMLLLGAPPVPLMGFYGMTFSLLIAYAVIYPERQMLFMLIFPMKAQHFCLILIGIEFYMMFLGPQGLYSFAHLSQCAIALYLLRNNEAANFLASVSSRVKKFSKGNLSSDNKRKRHLYVIKDNEKEDNDEGPKYFQ
jgi:membrane associated rhomboid family serine protease